MKGKAFIPLALGLGMGLVAVKLLVDTLQKAKGSTDEKQTITVVRATQDIGAFEKIAAEFVDVVETANNAFVPSDQRITSLEDVIGRVTAKTIPAGTPVLQSMLAPPGTTPGMVGKIPKGFRAFSVKIDEVSGVAYQLKPGDWVDVIALMDVATGERGKKETISKIILENVQLAAMGRSTAGTQDDGTAAKMKPAKSATLLVPKEEIPKLHLWQTRGKLTLAMRGDEQEMNDHAEITYTESEMHGRKKTAGVVEQPKPTQVAQVAARPEQLQGPHSITVYRGSRESKQTAVQQVIFENPHSRNVVELRGSPVVQAEKIGRQSEPRGQAPPPNTDRALDPTVQDKPAFDDTEVE